MKKSEVRKPFLEMVESVVIPIGFVKQKTNEGYEYIKKDIRSSNIHIYSEIL